MSQNYNGGEEADHSSEITMQTLADGYIVPEPTLIATMINLETLLGQYQSLAAIDLHYLAQGQQPARSPFGDMRQAYSELIGQLDGDGNLVLHDDEAAIIRNALHIHPQQRSRFQLTNPLVAFAGFDDK